MFHLTTLYKVQASFSVRLGEGGLYRRGGKDKKGSGWDVLRYFPECICVRLLKPSVKWAAVDQSV